MNTLVTQGIVLSRTDYGEADRIVTMLTPDQGKLRLMARGVRRQKSKLAGGIELFSVSDITFIHGKGEIGTLISTRLKQHYGNIVTDLSRVQLGYDLIKLLNRATEDHPEPDYFELLHQAFQALDDTCIELDLIRLWYDCHILSLAGHMPNLNTDANDQKLAPNQNYNFDFDRMSFMPNEQGKFTSDHIKTLRLLFSGHPPATLQKIDGLAKLTPTCISLVQAMTQT